MGFPWRHMLILATFVAGPLLLTACGGDEQLTLDEYLQRFKEISETSGTQADAIIEEYETKGVGEDLQATQDYLGAYGTLARQVLKELNNLHPPTQARDAHEGYVAAHSDAMGLLEDLSDRVADLESPSSLPELLAELDGPDFDKANQRIARSCLELQEIADQNGIDVDLRCE